MTAAFAMTYTTLVSTMQSYLERDTDTELLAWIPTGILFAQRRIARELKILGMQEYVTGTFTAASGVITKPSRWLQTISMNLGAGSGGIYTCTISAGGTGYNFPPTVTTSLGGGTGATFSASVTNGVITQIVPTAAGTGYTGTFALTITPAAVDTAATGGAATATAAVGNNSRQFLYPRSYEYCRFYWPDSTLTGTPKFYADYDFSHCLVVPTPSDALPIEIAYYQVAQPIDSTNTTNWLTDNAPDLLLYAALLEAAPFLKNDDRIQVWQAMYDRAAQGFVTEDTGRASDRTTTRVRKSQ